MRTKSGWLRVLGITLAIAALAAFSAAGYLYRQITAPVHVSSEPPNDFDAKEAARKLQIYEEALSGDRQGFIRLSEVEINSRLEEKFFPKDGAEDESAPLRLRRCRVEFGPSSLAWVEWIDALVRGRRVQMAWVRVVEVAPQENGSPFHLRSMRLGRLRIPESCWAEVDARLKGADARFHERLDWLTRSATVEYATNETSGLPEIRLYTHRAADRR